MNEPLVSILIPCYNVEELLPTCLETVLNQTYTNLQVVLIDDGSKDGTWGVMQAYAGKDTRVEVYHQANMGVAATRNHLLSRVKGEYVLFVDSDDWMELNMVEFLVNTCTKIGSDVAMCGLVINDAPVSEKFSQKFFSQEETVKSFLFHKELKGSLWNKLVKTSLLHLLTFDPEISYGEDALFCWHFFQNVKSVIWTDRQLYHYRMNENSISHQTFDHRKLTGHKTWKTITEETARLWPQYLHIAQARWGMEDMYLLRQAGQSHYKKDDAIRQLQKTVRQFLPQMRTTGLLVGREVLNANIICRWYGYNYIYSSLSKLKAKLG